MKYNLIYIPGENPLSQGYTVFDNSKEYLGSVEPLVNVYVFNKEGLISLIAEAMESNLPLVAFVDKKFSELKSKQ